VASAWGDLERQGLHDQAKIFRVHMQAFTAPVAGLQLLLILDRRVLSLSPDALT